MYSLFYVSVRLLLKIMALLIYYAQHVVMMKVVDNSRKLHGKQYISRRTKHCTQKHIVLVEVSFYPDSVKGSKATTFLTTNET